MDPEAASSSRPTPAELHLTYCLLDSNLPTGGFVASSGLESYVKHGFLTHAPAYESDITGPSPSASSKQAKAADGILDFSLAEVDNYASTTLCFVTDAWRAVKDALSGTQCAHCQVGADNVAELSEMERKVDRAIRAIERLDKYHEATLLSHVSRRSSKAQGVAMLTLYTRGLSRPQGLVDWESEGTDDGRQEMADMLVERYKRLVRRGDVPGHLAACWGLVTAALDLPLERALHLHLFLHTRSLLSSSVRLNVLGPYASSQILLHPLRALIEDMISKYGHGKSGIRLCDCPAPAGDFWDWADVDSGPATTWPLGEVLTARHDLQHSRIFNS